MNEQPIVVEEACVFCGQQYRVECPRTGYAYWKNGVHIQHAMPELPAEDREFLISRVCPKCWDATFPEGDDEPEDEWEDGDE